MDDRLSDDGVFLSRLLDTVESLFIEMEGVSIDIRRGLAILEEDKVLGFRDLIALESLDGASDGSSLGSKFSSTCASVPELRGTDGDGTGASESEFKVLTDASACDTWLEQEETIKNAKKSFLDRLCGKIAFSVIMAIFI